MIDLVTFERILNHIKNKRINLNCLQTKAVIDLNEMAMKNKELILLLSKEYQETLFLSLIETDALDLFKDQDLMHLLNPFYQKIVSNEIACDSFLRSSLFSAVLHTNRHDLEFVLNWLNELLMKTSNMVYEGNIHRRILSVLKATKSVDFDVQDVDFVWELPKAKWSEMIEDGFGEIEEDSLAYIVFENWFKHNKTHLDSLDIEKRLTILTKFKNIFTTDELKNYFQKELFEIKEQLPEKKGYVRLNELLKIVSKNEDERSSVFISALEKVSIDKKLMENEFFYSKYEININSVINVILTEKMASVITCLGLPWTCCYNLSMDLFPLKEKKDLLFTLMGLSKDCSDADFKKAFSVLLEEQRLEIDIPEIAKYKLIAEFPEINMSIFFSSASRKGDKTNSINILESYLYLSEDDLDISEDGLELLKLMYKR